jgi:hypothetical protein
MTIHHLRPNPACRPAPRPRAIARRLRALLGGAAALFVFVHLSAQSTTLQVERDGDRLRLSAPGLRFLTGAPLERLRDGRSVTYGLQATLELERGSPRTTRVTRYVVFSYDLWEERFAAAQADAPKTAASHLTSAAAEAWCLELLSLPLRLVPADGTFVVKFECWLRDDRAQPSDAPSAATLKGLIDLFSRNARDEPLRWEAVSRRLRLSDFKDKASK